MKKRILQFSLFGLLVFGSFQSSNGQVNRLSKVVINGANPISREGNGIEFNEKLYFTGLTSKGDKELIEITRTPNNAFNSRIIDVALGQTPNQIEHSGDPHEYLAFGSDLYFVATDSNKYETLFKLGVNGEVSRVQPENEEIISPSQLFVFEGNIYFMASKKGVNEKVLRYYYAAENTLWTITKGINSDRLPYITDAENIRALNDSTIVYTINKSGTTTSYDLKAAKRRPGKRPSINDFNSSRSNRERGTFKVESSSDSISDVLVANGNYFVTFGDKLYTVNPDSMGVVTRVFGNTANLFRDRDHLYFTAFTRSGMRMCDWDLNMKKLVNENLFVMPNVSSNAVLHYANVTTNFVHTEDPINDLSLNIVTSESNLGDVPRSIESFNPFSGHQTIDIENDIWFLKTNPIVANAGLFLFGQTLVDKKFELLNWIVEKPTAVLSQNSSNAITLFPNPVENELHIETSNDYKNFEIFGFNGVLVKEGEFNDSTIYLSELSKGIYFIKFDNGSSYKFIKE